MTAESYSPGHSANASDFMAKRSLQSHGQFFAAHLTTGVAVLDCGCGPGTITLGIPQAVQPGAVTGVDFGSTQSERARWKAGCSRRRGSRRWRGRGNDRTNNYINVVFTLMEQPS